MYLYSYCIYVTTGSRLTVDNIRKLSEILKKFYRDTFKEIQTSPLDPESTKKFEQVYVNLLLLSENGYDDEEHIDYENIFEILTNRKDKSRIIFLGEAGVGKTTLLAKIAYDWAKGRRLQNIDVLLYIPLREFQKSSYFGDIIKSYVSQTGEKLNLRTNKIDNYVKNNRGNVMLLLDGFDEYCGDIMKPDPSNALVGTLRGDELDKTPVIVTTRPWRADQLIRTDLKGEIKHIRVTVEGFRQRDVKEYIMKYYGSKDEDSAESAESLVRLVSEDGSLVAENMAPFPIFCCMLCHMWKVKSRRDAIQKLQTFSQLFREMIQSLKAQWVAKDTTNKINQCDNSLRKIGQIALEGLLKKQLVFTRDTFTDCKEDMATGCEVGVLSSEKKLIQKKGQQREGKVSFPHKLFQEYLAGLYLSSLHGENPGEFGKLLKHKILKGYREFRYLLYFTAAHGTKNGGHAAKALISVLRSELEDEEFIMDVAFECHDEGSILPVVNSFTQRPTIKLTEQEWMSDYTRLHNKHIRSGYMYSWTAWSHSQVLRSIFMLL